MIYMVSQKNETKKRKLFYFWIMQQSHPDLK